jgi:hypothetical protein
MYTLIIFSISFGEDAAITFVFYLFDSLNFKKKLKRFFNSKEKNKKHNNNNNLQQHNYAQQQQYGTIWKLKNGLIYIFLSIQKR